MEPSLLELEITETSLVQSAGQVVELLTKLKEMGVRIAFDDFGVGYSSLELFETAPYRHAQNPRVTFTHKSRWHFHLSLL